jgi:hypothetical protein
LDNIRKLEIQLHSLLKWQETGHYEVMWSKAELERRIYEAQEGIRLAKKEAILGVLKK